MFNAGQAGRQTVFIWTATFLSPWNSFSRLFCGLIVSLVFLNLFPSPACFLGPSAEWCPASLKSKLQRWRVGGGAGGGGWGARKAWSLGALPLGESPSRRRPCPPPNTRKLRGRSKELSSRHDTHQGAFMGWGTPPRVLRSHSEKEAIKTTKSSVCVCVAANSLVTNPAAGRVRDLKRGK